MENLHSISVIIPNYNGEKLLQGYLPATFAALNNTGQPYEVIIVDDCSTDDSVPFLKANYPEVTLLQNEENRGFSYTCNYGIAIAKHELIFLLNSDVKLLPNYFAPLWKYFADPDCFGVTGRIIDMEGDRLQDAARMPGFNGFKIKSKYFFYSEDPHDKLYTFYLSGANALVDAKKLKELGAFDELFSPFYGEDLDLGIRAWRNGWKCFYEHQAICRHQQSSTTKNYKTAQWVKQVYFRNRFFVHALHLNNVYYALWIAQILVIDVLPKLVSGRFWVWKSYTDFFKMQPAVRQSRERNKVLMHKHGSKISLLDIFRKVQGTTDGKEIKKFKV